MASNDSDGPSDADLKALERELRASFRAVREARVKALTGRQLAPDEPPFCSFCGAGNNNARVLLPSNGEPPAHICDDCIEAAHRVVQAI